MERDDTCCKFIAANHPDGEGVCRDEVQSSGFCRVLAKKPGRRSTTSCMKQVLTKKKVLQNLMKSLERLSVSFRSWLWLLHFCCSGNVTGGLQRDEVAHILLLSVRRLLETESRPSRSSFKRSSSRPSIGAAVSGTSESSGQLFIMFAERLWLRSESGSEDNWRVGSLCRPALERRHRVASRGCEWLFGGGGGGGCRLAVSQPTPVWMYEWVNEWMASVWSLGALWKVC